MLAWLNVGVDAAGALVGAVLGTGLSAYLNVADRIKAGRRRRGDLASVSVEYEHWHLGQMETEMQQVGPGSYVNTQPGVGFPITVTNGSGEKLTNVEYGIRWRLVEGKEVRAGFTPVLLPDAVHSGTAWEGVDESAFEPWDFDDVWLGRIAFYVRFTDQQGKRHENVRIERPTPEWTSVELVQ